MENNTNNEKLVKMIKSGFAAVDDLAIMVKHGFDEVDNRLSKLEQGQTDIKSRLDSAVYRFEFFELERRIEILEAKMQK